MEMNISIETQYFVCIIFVAVPRKLKVNGPSEPGDRSSGVHGNTELHPIYRIIPNYTFKTLIY